MWCVGTRAICRSWIKMTETLFVFSSFRLRLAPIWKMIQAVPGSTLGGANQKLISQISFKLSAAKAYLGLAEATNAILFNNSQIHPDIKFLESVTWVLQTSPSRFWSCLPIAMLVALLTKLIFRRSASSQFQPNPSAHYSSTDVVHTVHIVYWCYTVLYYIYMHPFVGEKQQKRI